MSKIKKIFTKQIVLLIIALLICFVLGYIDEKTILFWDYFYESFYYVFFTITILFYLPLAFLYVKRIKRKENIDNLHKVFRFANWIAIVLLLPFFLFGVWQIFYKWPSDSNFWQNLWAHVRYYTSWGYFIDIDLGLLQDLKELVLCLPFLLVSILFYWINKINKSLSGI